jgi:hypothetical protein
LNDSLFAVEMKSQLVLLSLRAMVSAISATAEEAKTINPRRAATKVFNMLTTPRFVPNNSGLRALVVNTEGRGIGQIINALQLRVRALVVVSENRFGQR